MTRNTRQSAMVSSKKTNLDDTAEAGDRDSLGFLSRERELSSTLAAGGSV